MTKSDHACSGCKQSRLDFDFVMAFQPIVDLQEQRIDGHEALVRGPAGEGAGTVIAQVTEGNLYAFDQACRVRAIESAARLGLDGNLSINFLPNAVYDAKACIRMTLAAAARSGFPLNRLIFEFTENEQMAEEDHLRSIMNEYRRHGFRVALDDFGTGYSGLSRLANLRPDIIKLDRALVQNCDQDGVRLAIVGSMVRLAAEIGIKVVAEGIERPGEMEALRFVGVRYMQGFHFARPALGHVTSAGSIPWPEPALA
ncbi:EAL domain-containing protein [Muricoccus vinaceus]|uniref:EAL domain-containing protein n=1 Tax=Muricoccus vinaceus TaxID=424704 RepID=A0ABV6IT25_9PROT